MSWFDLLRTKKQAPAMSVWRLQALFTNFRRILDLNNAVLERMAEMEQALGGEYIFDRPFLENSVRRIAGHVHHVVYCLNALTGNAHVPLYDKFQDILAILDTILAGGLGPWNQDVVLPLRRIGWELEPLVGIEAVCMAELRHHAGVRVADGVVITVPGVDCLLQREASRHHLSTLDVEEALARTLGELGTGDLLLDIVGVPAGDMAGMESEEDIDDYFSLSIHFTPAEKEPEIELSWRAREIIHQVHSVYVEQALEAPFAVLIYVSCARSITGTVQTRSAEDRNLLRIDAGHADGPEDFFFLRRVYPFELVRSTIRPRSCRTVFPDGLRASEQSESKHARGSALIGLSMQISLAETALALERMLGLPAAVEWAKAQDDGCVLSRVRPLPVPADVEPGPELVDAITQAEVLCRGGQPVQSGVAAGRAVHVSDQMDSALFPLGAVAIARTASPRLTPVLHRASAIITEYGTAAGHLATVARELRLPSVFGLTDATSLIPDGAEVTVDAAEGTVYAGVIEPLLHHAATGGDLYPTDPEYRTLRRLLRFIMPLHLVNPDGPGFSAQDCRTMHDIIHYCHEQAVDELAHFQERRPELGSIRTRRMTLHLPMDIRVLDIGGGVIKGAGEHPGVEHIRSAPMNHFLKGLGRPEVWETQAANLGMGDILAGMPRSMAMLQSTPTHGEESLAIVGTDYLNLNLRMGYHFSVVDSYLGPDESRNYVYFRFVGGLAGPRRRARRARFISKVLERMDFRVRCKGDLVFGRLKLIEPWHMEAALEVLGALTAFTRQQDTALTSDEDVTLMFARFAGQFMRAFDGHGGEQE